MERRRNRSTIGLGAALVLLLGQAAALAHLALVEHRRCPEHGETVHAAAIAARAPAPATTNVAVATAPGEDDDGEAADEHCLASALTASATDLPRPASVPAVLAAPALPGPLPFDPAPPLAILGLAPKHGPPRGPV